MVEFQQVNFYTVVPKVNILNSPRRCALTLGQTQEFHS